MGEWVGKVIAEEVKEIDLDGEEEVKEVRWETRESVSIREVRPDLV